MCDQTGSDAEQKGACSGAGADRAVRGDGPSAVYRLRVFRYDEARSDPPRFQDYEVAMAADASLLTALFHIQDEQDPSLAFRYSCRGLVCGSCGVVVSGHLTLACRTRLSDLPAGPIVVEPLPGFDVIKDLVVDLQPFWEKYERVEPWLHADLGRDGGVRMSEQDHAKIDALAHCILCGLCYASCPQVAQHDEFTGPAALAKLYRFVADSRERRHPETWQGENRHAGVWGCRVATRCIEVCPKNVRPFDGISALRRKLAVHTLASLLPGFRHES